MLESITMMRRGESDVIGFRSNDEYRLARDVLNRGDYQGKAITDTLGCDVAIDETHGEWSHAIINVKLGKNFGRLIRLDSLVQTGYRC